MNFSTYADFRTKVHQLIDGDDISQSDLSAEVLDLIVDMGEQRLYREVRSSAQDAAFSVAVSSNSVTLPSDLLQLRSVYFSGNVPVEVVPLERLYAYQTDTGGGDAVFAAHVGDTLVFWPSQSSGTLIGRYYKKFSDISAGITSNTLFARHPDLFLYAALSEAAPFISDDRLQAWEAKYRSVRDFLNNEEKRRVWSAGKVQTRVA